MTLRTVASRHHPHEIPLLRQQTGRQLLWSLRYSLRFQTALRLLRRRVGTARSQCVSFLQVFYQLDIPLSLHITRRACATEWELTERDTKAHGRVRRASLGIEGATTHIPRHVARFASVEQEAGVRVMKVLDGGPAVGAEIKPGDLIIAIDGEKVLGIDDMLKLLNHERVNRPVRITLLRRGEMRDRYVTPIERK